MKTIDASTVSKFRPGVGVSGTELMTEDLQVNFAKNTAFQGYMWVPCFCRSITSSGPGPHWFDIILPNAEIDVMVVGFNSDAIPTIYFFDIYQGDVKLVDGVQFASGNYFYETAYISRLTSNAGLHRLKIWTYYVGDVYPFTMFYRIVR